MDTNGDCRQRGTVYSIAMCEWDIPEGHCGQFCVRYVPSRQRSPNFQLLRPIDSLALTLCGWLYYFQQSRKKMLWECLACVTKEKLK